MQSGFFSEEEMGNNTNYQVLARKYRPQTFKDMIGQEALVQTLTNAFKSGRIAHAFVLTGIRGVGKTTTARIIARALNCIGADEKGGPTVQPCGVCTHCVSILEDRSQDVYEFDAASHTGVNDIREIIDNVRYKPLSARYKIYIIDEVHMLSNSAFNALLKTLEEPPAHVKFIFATTEIRKIPATILSRCQRFDLKRVSVAELSQHFSGILDQEGFSAEDDALKLVAKISAGSVRDGLSVIDQAIARSESKHVTAQQIQEMLGLATSEMIIQLFDSLIKGDITTALQLNAEFFTKSAEPISVLQDLMEFAHNVMLAKHGVELNQNLTEEENTACVSYAQRLEIATLSKLWQMLQKGLEEMKFSQMPFEFLDMLIIRIAYAANLPSVEEIVKRMRSDNSSVEASSPKEPEQKKALHISSFDQLIKLCYDEDEMILYHLLRSSVKLIALADNIITLKLTAESPKNFNTMLIDFLKKMTGQHWRIVISEDDVSAPTILQGEKNMESAHIASLKSHDSVKKVLDAFADMEIVDIKTNK